MTFAVPVLILPVWNGLYVWAVVMLVAAFLFFLNCKKWPAVIEPLEWRPAAEAWSCTPAAAQICSPALSTQKTKLEDQLSWTPFWDLQRVSYVEESQPQNNVVYLFKAYWTFVSKCTSTTNLSSVKLIRWSLLEKWGPFFRWQANPRFRWSVRQWLWLPEHSSVLLTDHLYVSGAFPPRSGAGDWLT